MVPLLLAHRCALWLWWSRPRPLLPWCYCSPIVVCSESIQQYAPHTLHTHVCTHAAPCSFKFLFNSGRRKEERGYCLVRWVASIYFYFCFYICFVHMCARPMCTLRIQKWERTSIKPTATKKKVNWPI